MMEEFEIQSELIERDLTATEKYNIYKKYGIEYLSRLTGKSIKASKRFIADYFKECCIDKVKDCVFKDILLEEEEKAILEEEREKLVYEINRQEKLNTREEIAKKLKLIIGFGEVENEFINIIIDKGNKGILQNELWKTLKMDRRKCSRFLEKLKNYGIIKKEPRVSNGSSTYLIKLDVKL